MHADAHAPADIADDGVARHRVTAFGEAHQHPVHAGNAHALGLADGLFLALLDAGGRGRGRGGLIGVEHGIEAVQNLTRSQMGVTHGGDQVVPRFRNSFPGPPGPDDLP